MRAPEPSELVKHFDIKSRQVFYNLDDNNIGDDGCERLSKANWPKIYQLNLGNFIII